MSGRGVVDEAEVATTIHCSNVSGVTVSLRVLLLNPGGDVADSHTIVNLVHGRTYTVSSRNTVFFSEDFSFLGLSIKEGAVNIESTNSAVFCTIKGVVDPESIEPTVFPFALVRVNPHPGTVE
jgi:hypothetical protein